MFELIGKATVASIALVVLAVVVYNLYDIIRAIVYGTDFLRWYIAQSKKTNPEYKMKVNMLTAWFEAIRTVYGYNASVKITHNNGAVYKPFTKV